MIGGDQRGGLAERDNLDVLFREAAGLQFTGQIFGIGRNLAASRNCVERDRLAEDFSRLVDIDLFGACRGRRGESSAADGRRL